VPDLTGSLDLAHLGFFDKEFFTAERRRRELDLLVRVSFLGDGGQAILVHVEVEARATAGMGGASGVIATSPACPRLPDSCPSCSTWSEAGPASVQKLTRDLLGPA